MARKQQITAQDIKTIARQQMAEKGTAGLSLRGIARQLDVTAPAIYNYFPRMDDLITALLIDSFNGLADAVDTAVSEAAQAGEAIGTQLKRAAMAYRQWAMAHQADFDLIYGNPIPGYNAPAEVTIPLARRPLETFYRLLLAAHQTEVMRVPTHYQSVPPSITRHVSGYLYIDFPELRGLPMSLFYLMMVVWSRLHGIVMLELHGHSTPTIGDAEWFYEHEVDVFLWEVGLSDDRPIGDG